MVPSVREISWKNNENCGVFFIYNLYIKDSYVASLIDRQILHRLSLLIDRYVSRPQWTRGTNHSREYSLINPTCLVKHTNINTMPSTDTNTSQDTNINTNRDTITQA